MEEDEGSSQTVALRLERLAAPVPRDRLPTYDALGLEPLANEADRWQMVASSGLSWGIKALSKAEPERWFELGGLMGSAGESVMLAGAAEVEVAALRQAIQDGSIPRAYGMSQRLFAEAEGQQILSVGHRLANTALRALMTSSFYPWGERDLGGLVTRFPPNSSNRNHWISIGQTRDLARLGEASKNPAVQRIVEAVIGLRDSLAWRALDQQRASDFHRQREVSEFLSRFELRSEHGVRTLTGFGSPWAEDPGPQQKIDAICATSHDALDALLPALQEIRRGWEDSFESTT